MLKNHLKIAFRQIRKQKFYSAINVLGLAIGVTCCLLIALFIKDELSYDKQHPNSENLYRVAFDLVYNDFTGKSAAVPPILTPTLVDEIPEITSMARINPHFLNAGSNILRRENDKEGFYEEGFVYADQSLFDLLNLPLVSGDKNKILEEPFTMVISEKMAEKYFGNENPVGQTLVMNNEEGESYKITGVMENIIPQNHFHYDFFMSMNTLDDSKNTNWIYNNYYAYVTMKDGTNPADLEGKLRDFVFKNFGPQFKKDLNADLHEMEKRGEGMKIIFQPVTDIHLKSQDYTQPYEAQGDIANVRIFGIIALFIFLIALVNFVNLSTARSANRAKEVGLRKVLGSFQKQLMGQFLTESILLSVLAFMIGTGLAAILIPSFNELAGKNLSIPFSQLYFIPLMMGGAVLAGLLAGLYPSFYLSGFEPVKVLKGKLSLGSKSGWLRSGLVTFQFAISIALIIGTLIVYQQMQYIQNKDLGFEKEQVLLIQDVYTLFDQKTNNKKLYSFKEEIKKIPEAKNASLSSYLPLDGGSRNSIPFKLKGNSDIKDQVLMQQWSVDEDYINTLSMNIIAGRNFEKGRISDSLAVILNKKATVSLGIADDPIGQKIDTHFDPERQYTVIGVVDDFNYESLKGEVKDLALFLRMSSSIVSIKTTEAEMESLIAKAEGVWKSFAPTQPFRYDFMDDRFEKMYKSEDRVGTLFGIFSLLAIFIACLGLLALATFMTEQRMKEIGIRKVLGASVSNIVFQLSKSFLLYVLIGLIIATPIAWLQMNSWLENFAYRINIEWWMFAIAGLLAVGIAFLTVGSKSLVAALSNPVNSLKNE